MPDDFRRRLQGPTHSAPECEGDFFTQPLSREPVLSSPQRHSPHSLLRDLAITSLFVAPAIAIGIYGPYQRFVDRNTIPSSVQGVPSEPSCEELRNIEASQRTANQDTYLKNHCN